MPTLAPSAPAAVHIDFEFEILIFRSQGSCADHQTRTTKASLKQTKARLNVESDFSQQSYGSKDSEFESHLKLLSNFFQIKSI